MQQRQRPPLRVRAAQKTPKTRDRYEIFTFAVTRKPAGRDRRHEPPQSPVSTAFGTSRPRMKPVF
jgi:hypothetical protein